MAGGCQHGREAHDNRTSARHRSRATEQESNMSTKIIVSYDGTANEDDAIALGRIFARAGAEVSLAYVRHAREVDSGRETAVAAEGEQADVIVFCSDSHTADGHIAIGNSAERLLEGGPAAIAIAPVGLGDQD